MITSVPETPPSASASLPYSSNFNVALYSHDLSFLQNPRVVLAVDSALSDTDTIFGANSWTWQLNIYSPPGFRTSYHQYVPYALQGQFALGITYAQSNDLLFANANASLAVPPLPFPVGWKLDMTIQTDPITFYAKSVKLAVIQPNGTVWNNDQVTLPITSLRGTTAFDPSWYAPMSAMTLSLIGAGNGSTANFSSSAAGRFLYYPSGGQKYDFVAWDGTQYPFPTGLPIQRAQQHTSEKSNLGYSALSAQQADGSYSQQFAIQGSVVKTPTMMSLTAKQT